MRRVLLALVLTVATLSMACESSVGVGLGVSYPGRYYGPVDAGGWGGGPVW
jgi:hypothetical protein